MRKFIDVVREVAMQRVTRADYREMERELYEIGMDRTMDLNPSPGITAVRHLRTEAIGQALVSRDRGRLVRVMWAALVAFFVFAMHALALSGCATNARPAFDRAPAITEATSVKIEQLCIKGDPFKRETVAVLGGYGSGVIVGPHHVLTAAHVIECPGVGQTHVTTSTGRRLVAEIDRKNVTLDIARLYVAEGFLGITRPALGAPAMGEPVCAATSWPERGRTCGQIVSLGAVRGGAITHSAAIKPGNSGSGLYSGARLVGIVITRRFCDHLEELLGLPAGCGGGAALVPASWVP